MFLLETHSVSDVENACNDDFKGHVFFSHGKSNSCGVLIAYLSSTSFVVKSKRNNHHTGHILILEFTIGDTDYNLINIYQSRN